MQNRLAVAILCLLGLSMSLSSCSDISEIFDTPHVMAYPLWTIQEAAYSSYVGGDTLWLEKSKRFIAYDLRSGEALTSTGVKPHAARAAYVSAGRQPYLGFGPLKGGENWPMPNGLHANVARRGFLIHKVEVNVCTPTHREYLFRPVGDATIAGRGLLVRNGATTSYYDLTSFAPENVRYLHDGHNVASVLTAVGCALLLPFGLLFAIVGTGSC